MLENIKPNSIGSIVTDPPYELNFMNKGWDNSGIAFRKETWDKCYKVLKSGGYLLAFGGSRTFHRIACAIEDAGFEIRDTIMWMYGSGFPKSMNIGLAIDRKNGIESQIIGIGKSGDRSTHTRSLNFVKGTFGGEYEQKLAQNEWSGWGTALKPAYEPIIVARKPCEGSCIDNVLKYGVGGIDIDECRVPTDEKLTHGGSLVTMSGDERSGKALGIFLAGTENTYVQNPNGRFPANVILSYDDADSDEVCGGFPKIKNELSASRYFYCAKASKKDRDEGLDNLEDRALALSNQAQAELKRGNLLQGEKFNSVKVRKNIHPTVKPTELMQYLVRLVTPEGETVLDPFNGSGSTGKAVMYENNEKNKNYKYIGIELNEEYLQIAKARIDYVIGYDRIVENNTSEKVTDDSQIEGQMSIFDFLK